MIYHNKPEWQRRADEYLFSLGEEGAKKYIKEIYNIFSQYHTKDSLDVKLQDFKKSTTK